MAISIRRARGALAAGVLLLSATAAGAGIRQFSFDPADEETRAAAGPVTFVVRHSWKRFMTSGL